MLARTVVTVRPAASGAVRLTSAGPRSARARKGQVERAGVHDAVTADTALAAAMARGVSMNRDELVEWTLSELLSTVAA